MIIYQLHTEKIVIRLNDKSFIPFDPDNTDYQTFKTDLTNGVVLNDAEGTPMTVEQIAQFLSTLP
jgi:hypothetical protein